jgi:hypothetical protein
MLANCRRLGGVMGGPDPRAGAGEDVTLGYGVILEYCTFE